MKRPLLAPLFLLLFFFSGFISQKTLAQNNAKTKVTVSEVPPNAIEADDEPEAPQVQKKQTPQIQARKASIALPAAVAPTPTPEPSIPWKIAYVGEYYGPRFGEALDHTSIPSDPPSSPGEYTSIDHSLKLGYTLNPIVTVGTQIRGTYNFDPSADAFDFKNMRLFASWNHMIETSLVDMKGQIDLDLPTTDKSRGKGMLFAVNLKNFWIFKTELRNWSFSVLTIVRPTFYNDPTNQTDFTVSFCPNATVDIAPDWQFQFDGSFDAAHAYSASFFDFSSGDYDSVTIGPIWSINSHIQLIPDLRFYADNVSFKAATIYVALSVAL